MSQPSVELFRRASAGVGEGPAWDAATETLLWVDIHACEVYREHLDGRTETTKLDRHVGAALPSANVGEMLLMVRDGFQVLGADGSLRTLTLPLADRPEVRFNDGKVDPRGRAFGGTMPYSAGDADGALYRLDPDAADGPTTTVVAAPLKLSNGLGWTPDASGMYLIDSGEQTVYRYDYDSETGDLSNRSVFLEVPAAEGMPDGLTVDDDGGVWVALWGGGAIRRYTPDARLDRVIELPASQVTSMCFIGADLRTLAVTSARYGFDGAKLAAEPLAGAVFTVDAGCTGPAATPWRPL